MHGRKMDAAWNPIILIKGLGEKAGTAWSTRVTENKNSNTKNAIHSRARLAQLEMTKGVKYCKMGMSIDLMLTLDLERHRPAANIMPRVVLKLKYDA